MIIRGKKAFGKMGPVKGKGEGLHSALL